MSVALASVQTAIDELRVLLGDRLSTSTGVRDHHSKDESWHIPHRPDAVAFPTSTEEVAQIVQICARHRTPVVAYGTGTSLEGNVIPRERRRGRRPDAHGQGPEGQRRGPRRDRAGARHPQAAERLHPRPGPVLPDRSGRRRIAGRHGRHARLGHQRRALRHDARERARPHGGARRRAHHPHVAARAQVRRRLRPHPPVRRQRGHARHHHRSDAAAVRHPRGDGCGSVLLRHARRRRQHRDPDHPARHTRSRASSCWTACRWTR